MKHFGAVLTGDNNIVDGNDSSNLTIGTSASNNDAIIIHNEAPKAAAANKIIPNAAAITAGTADFGLVLVPYSTVTYTGANNVPSHLLGADGREVAVSDLDIGASTNSVTGDIPVKGIDTDGETIFVNSIMKEIGTLNYDATGDNATSSTNSSATGIEIEGSLVISGSTSNLTVQGDATVNGDLTINGDRFISHSQDTFVSDRYFETNHPVAGSAYSNNLTGGFVVVQTASPSTATTTAVAVANTVNQPVTAPASGDLTLDFDNAIPAAPGGGDALILTVTAAANGAVLTTGFLVVSSGFGTTTATFAGPIDGLGSIPADGATLNFSTATLTSSDNSATGAGLRFNGTSWQAATSIPNLSTAATIDSTGNWADLTTATSGVNSVNAGAGLTEAGTGTAVDLDIDLTAQGSDGASGLGFSAGASDNGSTLQIADDGIWERKLKTDVANVSDDGFVGVATRSGTNYAVGITADGQFSYFSPASGTVGKHANTYTADASTALISIPAATHGLTGTDFTVIIYEYLTGTTGATQHTGSGAVTNLRTSQILPESVRIGTNSAGTGETLAGTVTIALPLTQVSNQFRVVVKS